MNASQPLVLDDAAGTIFVRWRGKTLRSWHYDSPYGRQEALEIARIFAAGVREGAGF
jgi:hypothetical protein